MGMGTGGIPTTDNIPETTEIINMIKLSVLKNQLSGILSVGYPSFSVVSGILSVVGIQPVPIPHTRGNSVAHVCVYICIHIIN
jgi:hypothetical protein